MELPTDFRRQAIRAAAKIREHLLGPTCLAPLPRSPLPAWEDLVKASAHYELARQRGWIAAGNQVLADLDYAAYHLRYEIDSFKMKLPRPVESRLVASAGEIVHELLALQEEFEEVELDLKERAISVLTSSIELEGMDLGPFRIVLSWPTIGWDKAYEVIATDPKPAETDPQVTHPHVRNGELCEGEGAGAIKTALSQGRILDFFTLITQILRTYNSASAYVRLTRWDGSSGCNDCGYDVSDDDAYSCDRCGETLCESCTSHCSACENTLCDGCRGFCDECEETFCRRCLQKHPETGELICESCLKEGENTDDESHDDDSSAEPALEDGDASLPAPADPVCVEEAAVPA